jgi:hypothetical protein
MRTVFRIETPSLVLRPLVRGDTQRMLEMSQKIVLVSGCRVRFTETNGMLAQRSSI